MGRWLLLACGVAVLAGTASAFFLIALDWATDTRTRLPWLLALLPLAGLAVGWIYHRWGQSVEAGNNLLIDEIHDPRAVVPLRMAPLVLGGTLVSHLFDASVGRQGTAVQMGGALAGAMFGLEVLAIGRLRYDALFPCMVAAIVADRVTLLWGAHHTHYLIGRVFAAATHALAGWMKRTFPYGPLRPLIGGTVVAAAGGLFGADRYLGLGIPTIVEAFQHPMAPHHFALKLAFTVASLGSGFKGGEVTPLFYVGATLGNALAPLLQMPVPLLAGVGFVAVFAGAANTPMASTLMAMELFGAEIGVYAGLACVVSYQFSGHSGIYRSQRIGEGKHRGPSG